MIMSLTEIQFNDTAKTEQYLSEEIKDVKYLKKQNKNLVGET